MDKFKRTLLITGGAGFIGSNLVRHFVRNYPGYRLVNYDKLTYAGNPANLGDVADAPNYTFVKGDICDASLLAETLAAFDVDGIINLAAESHVDRSITAPLDFAVTNVLGTLTLLQAAKSVWESKGWTVRGNGCRFYHISTDEVYGALAMGEDKFTENTKYAPHSPYSASKASSDHFVRAYHDTFGLPAIISNCSNNYGPYQFPEKLIPLCINNIRNRRPIPVYGRGENVRDWLYVDDHVRAIDLIFHKGRVGDTYNIGGENERKNIEIVRKLIEITDLLLGRAEREDENLITFVPDRKGHDLRYAIDSSKFRDELGWKSEVSFDEGMFRTVKWYLDNQEWLDSVTSGNYREYYSRMYENR